MSARPISAEEYAEIVQSIQELRTENPAGYAETAKQLGGEEVLSFFLAPRGVGLSQFAALGGLPASTIRHYIREELLSPYEINGKFRFHFVNLMQLRGVQRWQELGLSLSEIRAFLETEQLAGFILPGEGQDQGVVMIFDEPHPLANGGKMVANSPEEMRQVFGVDMTELRRHALSRAREATAKLAERHRELGERLDWARRLEARLATPTNPD